MYEKAFDLFEQMSLDPQESNFTIVFNASGHLSSVRAKEIGYKLLKQMPINNQNSNHSINSAIDMLMKFGDVQRTEDLFGSILKKGIVTDNVMLKGKLL